MTLQQLRYVVKIVESGSMNAAAKELFVSQPSLSKAVTELEKELNITIFHRNKKGISLSEEGIEFLSYARQVIEQAELLERQYKNGNMVKKIFSVSLQHYIFAAEAFRKLIENHGEGEYEFTLKEARTFDVIEDVRTHRSEIGIMYLSQFNHSVLEKTLSDAGLQFEALYRAKPHVLLSRSNPLAKKGFITSEKELFQYPRINFEQGIYNSFYYYEELYGNLSSPKKIMVSDKATMFNLLLDLNGYTVASGLLSEDLKEMGIVSVPVACTEYMDIGYIHFRDTPISTMGENFIRYLEECILAFSRKNQKNI